MAKTWHHAVTRKGFTLFTPLVGTAVMIMSVLIVSSMLQNDMRLSRTLASSADVSSQLQSANMVKANIFGATMMCFENKTLTRLNTTSDSSIRVSCNGANDCKTKARDQIAKTMIKADLKDWLFDNIGNSLKSLVDILSFKKVEFGTEPRNLKIPDNAITVEYLDSQKGELKEKLYADKFQGQEAKFSAVFTDYRGNEMQMPIIPPDFEYITEGDEIARMISAGADAYQKVLDGSGKTNDATAGQVESALKDWCGSQHSNKIKEVFFDGELSPHLIATWHLNLNAAGETNTFSLFFSKTFSGRISEAKCCCKSNEFKCNRLLKLECL